MAAPMDPQMFQQNGPNIEEVIAALAAQAPPGAEAMPPEMSEGLQPELAAQAMVPPEEMAPPQAPPIQGIPPGEAGLPEPPPMGPGDGTAQDRTGPQPPGVPGPLEPGAMPPEMMDPAQSAAAAGDTRQATQQVGYDWGICCGVCVHFIHPESCELVNGHIRPDAVCQLFELTQGLPDDPAYGD